MRCRQVDAALDPSRSAVAVATRAGVVLGREGVQGAHRAVADRLRHLRLADHKRSLLAHDKAAGRLRLSRAGLDRSAFTAPFLPTAVEHSRVVEAEDAQQPPDAGRPPRIGGAVEHDVCALADAKPAHRRGERLGRRQHETEALAVIREIGLEIDELRAGNMPLFEFGPRRHSLISGLRVGYQVGGAVKNAQTGFAESARQRIGLDQELGMGKAFRCAHADFAFYRCYGKDAAIEGRWRWNSVACSKAWPTRITPASSNGLPAI